VGLELASPKDYESKLMIHLGYYLGACTNAKLVV